MRRHPEAIPLLESARSSRTLCGAANAIASAKAARVAFVQREPDEDPLDSGVCATITSPAPDSHVSPGDTVTFTWTEVPGAAAYALEFTGKDRRFSNPNGLTADRVNGFGGAGGALVQTGTSLHRSRPAPTRCV